MQLVDSLVNDKAGLRNGERTWGGCPRLMSVDASARGLQTVNDCAVVVHPRRDGNVGRFKEVDELIPGHVVSALVLNEIRLKVKLESVERQLDTRRQGRNVKYVGKNSVEVGIAAVEILNRRTQGMHQLGVAVYV